MANRDGILQEIQRYIRRPKITFEKGIIRSDNDSVLGYVSDIHNMDIDKGVAKRRMGTKCLNDPDVAVKFKKLFWSNISGCDILFGITEKLELVAYVDRWLEIQFKVYKKGLSKIRYQNSDNSFQVKWDQGNQFHVVEDNASIKIINDFGQIYKIEKRGYIGLMKVSDSEFTYEDASDTQILGMIEEARYSTSAPDTHVTQFGLFVNVVDATNKTPDRFYAIEEDKSNSNTIYPVGGNVKVAYVNEDNVISKFGDTINLQEESYLFSAIPGMSASSNFEIIGIGDSTLFPESDIIIRGSASGSNTTGTTTTNEEYDYQIQSTFTSSPYTTYKAKLLVKESSSLPEYYVYFDETSSDLVLDTGNLDKLFTFDIVRQFKPFPISYSISGDIPDIFYEPLYIPNIIAEVDSYEENADIPSTYGTYTGFTALAYTALTALTDTTGTLVKLSSTSAGNSLVKKLKTISRYFEKATAADEYYVFGAMRMTLASAVLFHDNVTHLFEIEVKVDSSDRNIEYGLACKNKMYDIGVNSPFNTLVYDVGYDCWQNYGLISTSVDSIDLSEKIVNKIDISNERNVFLNDEEWQDYLQNGYRFAVWNNDEIIAMSQKAFTSDYSSIVYEDEIEFISPPVFYDALISETDTVNKGGTVSSVTFGDGAATFSGSGEILYSGTGSLNMSTDWTIIAVVNPTASNDQFILSKDVGLPTTALNMYLRSTGTVNIMDSTLTPIALKDSSGVDMTYTTSSKQFIAISSQLVGANQRIFGFKDGDIGTEFTLTNKTVTSTDRISVGGKTSSGLDFTGDIYYIAVFDYALTSEQIESIYNEQSWMFREVQKNNYGVAYNKPAFDLNLTYPPVCAPVYKTLRSFPYKIDPFEDIITSPKHIVNNNGRLYCIQGRRLWGGNFNTMKLTTPKELDYDVYRMEKFFDGVILFTNRGMYRVDAQYNIYEVNSSAISSTEVIASTNGGGKVFGITADNEVFFIVIRVENNSTPYAEAIKISQAVHNVNWTARPKMVFVRDTLWIARDDDVWGYYEGGWKKKYKWSGKIIDEIVNYKDRLCISFCDSRELGVYDAVSIISNDITSTFF